MSDVATVETRHGRLRGEVSGDLVHWRGIPYAQPPVGPLRFCPPVPVQDWSSTRQAVDHGPVAWQALAKDTVTGDSIELSCDEDCLYLNVTAPAEWVPGGYPVMLWLHGGGYVAGSGPGGVVGDGAALARHGLVVVTFNYRLGALGFLYVDELLNEPGRFPGAGSVGLLDQVAALRWVHSNIESFGGDPKRITIYGVSAGAKSVANLLASPAASGLVAGAISSCGGAEQIATVAEGRRLRKRLLTELELAETRASELRSVPAPDIVAAQEAIATGARSTYIWRPITGTEVLPVPPLDAIAAGASAHIPLLIGNNGNEGATYDLIEPTTADRAESVLVDLFGPAAAAAMWAAYQRARPELDDHGIALAVFGDERYAIPTQRLALAHARHAPVWRYRYDTRPPLAPVRLAGGHGMDSRSVWSDPAAITTAESAKDDTLMRVAQSMAGTWAGFAAGRRLESVALENGLPRWPQYTADLQDTMILDESPHLEQHPRREQFAIWEGRSWTSGTWWDLGEL